MMKYTYINLCLVATVSLFSCKSQEKAVASNEKVTVSFADEMLNSVVENKVYQETEARLFDLTHTRLDVKFDWEKQQLIGQAELHMKPYFYPQEKVIIDAKGFDVKTVILQKPGERKELRFHYNQKEITVFLDKKYTRNDSLTLVISYIAKPNELAAGGSAAITSDKGLYFINADGKTPGKPSQIWTQGETESSSCWFPTIDIPNERMTQEIYITVDKKYKTLSNGLLLFQTENGDGTRTDYWKQNLPHAPYLAMMAIGDFSITKDSWNGMLVDYYLEKEYEQYAKEIFGRTPEMLTYYSDITGVKYPWEKYSQIVVRDYVSGAMENTSAVIHGEFVQKTTREMLDGNNDDIIAHELFHHWFGDYVTCESWSNLPLNESFATYGEYLWSEYKNGKEEADYGINGDLNSYLSESRYKQEDMIRFHYEDKEDMFDSHSYAKGGRILHMLRNVVGDEAFFAGLKKYLTDNRFKSAEIHDLRLAFEEVTGRDLNWFFNQWFLSSGHPKLKISQMYFKDSAKVFVTLEQLQNRKTTPLYRLPMKIDVYYADGTKMTYEVEMTEQTQSFGFRAAAAPLLVNVDADKVLLCDKEDIKPTSQWLYQFKKAPLFKDRIEALEYGIAKGVTDTAASRIILLALQDRHWNIRQAAVNDCQNAFLLHKERIRLALETLAQNDPKTSVKSAAMEALNKHFGDSDYMHIYASGLNGQSLLVAGTCLKILKDKDSKQALITAKRFEEEKSAAILLAVADVYAYYGDQNNYPFMKDLSNKVSSYSRMTYIRSFAKYLENNSERVNVGEGMEIFVRFYSNGGRYSKHSSKQALEELQVALEKKEKELSERIKTKPKDLVSLENEKLALKDALSKIESTLNMMN